MDSSKGEEQTVNTNNQKSRFSSGSTSCFSIYRYVCDSLRRAALVKTESRAGKGPPMPFYKQQPVPSLKPLLAAILFSFLPLCSKIPRNNCPFVFSCPPSFLHSLLQPGFTLITLPKLLLLWGALKSNMTQRPGQCR